MSGWSGSNSPKKAFFLRHLLAGLLFVLMLSEKKALSEELGSYTVRCEDGVLLILGKIKALKQLKEELKNTTCPSVAALKKQVEKRSGWEEVAAFFDPDVFFFRPTPLKESTETVGTLRQRFRLQGNPFRWFQELERLGFQIFHRGKLPFSLYLESGGKLAGNASHIIVEGKEYSAQKRGLNVVVVDGENFSVKSSESFDTYLLSSEVKRFQDFLEKMESGDYLIISVMDEAGRQFNKSAFQTLARFFGARRDLTRRKHFSYAFVGKKGAKEPIFEKLSNAQISVFLPREKPLPRRLFAGLIFFHGFADEDKVLLVE